MANSSATGFMDTLSGILTSLQQGVVAINGLFQTINKVASTTSSGAVTIRLIQVSS